MDDPRWVDDPRSLDDNARDLSRGNRGGLSDPRDRASVDPRDVFMKDLDLPRGPDRDRVRARGGDVTLRGSESRTLVGTGPSQRAMDSGSVNAAQTSPTDAA